MKIGIVSNSKICTPLLLNLSRIKAGVMLYYSPSVNADISVAEMAGFCRMQGISFYAETDKKELYQWQQVNEPDIIFITGYSNKIAVDELGGVSKGVYNIHFGALPQYRGPSPVFWQLRNGEPNIGITVHQLTDKFDSGPVAWTGSVRNEAYSTYSFINQQLSELQVNGVFEILNKLSAKQPISLLSQDENIACYYGKPQLANVFVNWETMDAGEIINMVKACVPWNNGAIAFINGIEFKILDAETAEKVTAAPSTINTDNNKFNVACKNNTSLSINFFKINDTSIPARHAGFYGFKTGQQFTSKI
ncbi:hypothetical protein D0C36_18970 [Mucilaginibacter conchicola]|uniref:Uncharacterized protein n=1 Tax=Mucilaginibacter conchicola TaxID=2303333 RepID=A0A372NQZ6_9SPHI|nr:formyltransferase family protein [Mucilaginibacter conchicola]RFZ91027.1 hypothetical protein D0C36_18970 [Mucilaginibacter conchicola]